MTEQVEHDQIGDVALIEPKQITHRELVKRDSLIVVWEAARDFSDIAFNGEEEDEEVEGKVPKKD